MRLDAQQVAELDAQERRARYRYERGRAAVRARRAKNRAAGRARRANRA